MVNQALLVHFLSAISYFLDFQLLHFLHYFQLLNLVKVFCQAYLKIRFLMSLVGLEMYLKLLLMQPFIDFLLEKSVSIVPLLLTSIHEPFHLEYLASIFLRIFLYLW
jgi:hypothetical protein